MNPFGNDRSFCAARGVIFSLRDGSPAAFTGNAADDKAAAPVSVANVRREIFLLIEVSPECDCVERRKKCKRFPSFQTTSGAIRPGRLFYDCLTSELIA